MNVKDMKPVKTWTNQLGERRVYRFDNGFGVLAMSYTTWTFRPMWSAMQIKFIGPEVDDYKLTFLRDRTELTWDQVEATLAEVQAL